MRHLNIGFLHPGAMGISVAVSAQNSGHTAYWLAAGRSVETHARAEEHGLIATQNMAELCEQCDIIISVCPPHAAVAVAEQILAAGFQGIYADVNAIAPQKAEQIGQMMDGAGVMFADGGIIGGPAWEPGRTWLYLSGPAADQVAAVFANGPLETEIVDQVIGSASALKMTFAAYTKGTTALLSAILATAEQLGVRPALEKQWSRNGSTFAEDTRNRVSRVTAKAWRFSGEMEEIAATMAAAGLPNGFHLAARDVYDRIAHFKGADETPAVEEVLASLLNTDI